jgi:hypothetical protein
MDRILKEPFERKKRKEIKRRAIQKTIGVSLLHIIARLIAS